MTTIDAGWKPIRLPLGRKIYYRGILDIVAFAIYIIFIANDIRGGEPRDIVWTLTASLVVYWFEMLSRARIFGWRGSPAAAG